MTSKLSNIDIAQAANMRRITDVAQERLGIPEEALSSYGRYKAKISLDYLSKMNGRKNGKLVLVTAISPTPAGEGKTTTTVGLGDALNLIGKKALICLREPALGDRLREVAGEFFECTDDVLARASALETHQGVAVLFARPVWQDEQLLKGEKAPLVLCAAGVRDPGNLGALLRTAEAA